MALHDALCGATLCHWRIAAHVATKRIKQRDILIARQRLVLSAVRGLRGSKELATNNQPTPISCVPDAPL
jgi:hypothetical protein